MTDERLLLIRKIHADLADIYDEELELKLDDRIEDESADGDKAACERYFRELFRLQGELVKLQDWVIAQRHKVVILFEGRDAAGKGGVIKRITQRLNCIHHLLSQMPYEATEHAPISLPERVRHDNYVRSPVPDDILVPEIY